MLVLLFSLFCAREKRSKKERTFSEVLGILPISIGDSGRCPETLRNFFAAACVFELNMLIDCRFEPIDDRVHGLARALCSR